MQKINQKVHVLLVYKNMYDPFFSQKIVDDS